MSKHFYNGSKKIYNENNFNTYSEVEKFLFTKSYENWSKEQQQFFKEAMNSSGKGKEMEKDDKDTKINLQI